MMFMNLIWAWGHPEVYILVLPAFGMFSEVVSTFSGKPLFGYRSMVMATMAICIISFMVWLHHFFTMGAGADVNAFFGIATMIIAVPTGVKIFNWLFTMYGGRVRFETPMLWSIGFMVTFAIGGMTGVLLAVPPADFVLHNSLFLVAHFHNVIIGGVLFGAFAGYTYWFPKAFGFRLDERLGQGGVLVLASSASGSPSCRSTSVGLEGMTRRLQHYDVPAWQPWLLVRRRRARSIILCGVVCQIAQLVVSIRAARDAARPDRRSLGRPHARVGDRLAAAGVQLRGAARRARRGAYWGIKQRARGPRRACGPSPSTSRSRCRATAPPASSCAFFAAFMGFALIWHIWWLVIARPRRAPTRPSSCSPGATTTRTSFRPRRWRAIDRANRQRPRRGAA